VVNYGIIEVTFEPLDWTTSNVIRNYVENKGNHEDKGIISANENI